MVLFPSDSSLSFIIDLAIFISCCKVHDFCEGDADTDPDKCFVDRREEYKAKTFLYNKDTNKCCKYHIKIERQKH